MITVFVVVDQRTISDQREVNVILCEKKKTNKIIMSALMFHLRQETGWTSVWNCYSGLHLPDNLDPPL